MADDNGVWRHLSEGFKAEIPKRRTWKTVGEQEDWLRTKGKLLGFVTEVLANGLRDEFPALPAPVEHVVLGYITPVAAEYVRRAIWHDTTLSEYEKLQLHLFTVRTYAYVIGHYRGRFPNAEQCIDEIVHAQMAPLDAAFFTRMRQVTPFFDEHFRPEKRDPNMGDDDVFTVAFLYQVMRILRQTEVGRNFNISEQDAVRVFKVFDTTARTIRQMLAD